ncbi:hypothetical protein CBR_g40768 [Chara braunii]|uniref:Uncharacterized protein n=1 Tax=Chara braunii TaxID=69332 RepID=A0A388LUG0_CHABU|nr:hypothetical protein CBR_g40768 [Chara braunii]|eukprot:GBG85956.1 hypothetical protein CBR_g40768 [Chara braunii]
MGDQNISADGIMVDTFGNAGVWKLPTKRQLRHMFAQVMMGFSSFYGQPNGKRMRQTEMKANLNTQDVAQDTEVSDRIPCRNECGHTSFVTGSLAGMNLATLPLSATKFSDASKPSTARKHECPRSSCKPVDYQRSAAGKSESFKLNADDTAILQSQIASEMEHLQSAMPLSPAASQLSYGPPSAARWGKGRSLVADCKAESDARPAASKNPDVQSCWDVKWSLGSDALNLAQLKRNTSDGRCSATEFSLPPQDSLLFSPRLAAEEEETPRVEEPGLLRKVSSSEKAANRVLRPLTGMNSTSSAAGTFTMPLLHSFDFQETVLELMDLEWERTTKPWAQGWWTICQPAPPFLA